MDQFLHPIPLVQSSRSTQHMQTVQLFLNIVFLSCAGNFDVGPVYASQIKKLRKRICRVEPAPLWTSSYTQYLLYKAQDPFRTCRQSQLFLNIFFIYRTRPIVHRSRNSVREFAGWNQLPCGPVLTPNISCTKLKIHSAHADSPIVPKPFFSSCAGNLDVGQVYASQIRKLRKRICRVEPAPLWVRSYTQYLLYKVRDPFNACRQFS